MEAELGDMKVLYFHARFALDSGVEWNFWWSLATDACSFFSYHVRNKRTKSKNQIVDFNSSPTELLIAYLLELFMINGPGLCFWSRLAVRDVALNYGWIYENWQLLDMHLFPKRKRSMTDLEDVKFQTSFVFQRDKVVGRLKQCPSSRPIYLNTHNYP